jgi:serine protease inhibitor
MSVATDLHAGFAADLLRALAPAGGEHVVVSPWSVSSALAVLAPGCDEPARREIGQALGQRADTGDLPALLAAHAATVAEAGNRAPSDEGMLAVANTLWVEHGRTPVPGFLRLLDRWPGAALRSAFLAADPEGARAAVNADVALTTRDLIREILPAGSLTGDERAVIVNALYLLAGWVEPFAEASTAQEPFHSPSGSRDLAMMRGSREVGYARDGWQYLDLPLRLGLRAEVLLPPVAADSHPGPLDPALLAELRDRAIVHRVDLHLPRFRAESATGLIEPLRALGVCRVFDASALVDVVAEEPLQVSSAFHAAVLRVDERGIEGAAATAMVARTVAYRRLPEVEVRVDRPFLFLVTHRETGVVVFLACVVEPEYASTGTG